MLQLHNGLYLPTPPMTPEQQRRAIQQFHADGRKLGFHPPISGGGGLSRTYTDMWYQNTADATALASFTTEASLLGGLVAGPPIIPAEFFDRANGIGRSLRICARGILSSTATPTYTLTIRFGTSAAGILLGTTAAMTTGSGVTNRVWQLEADLICRAVGSGTSATMQTGGIVQSGGLASPFAFPIPNDSTTWHIGFDSTVANSIWLGAACSANSASNTIQLRQILVFGLN